MEKALIKLIEAVDKNIKYCEWVRNHNVESYFKELHDEINELQEAIKNRDIKNIKEEMGDILWDILMLMKISEKEFKINNKEIVKGVVEKIKRRKPHVFEGKTLPIKETMKIWKEAKKKEKSN